jgi:hypothetical protein
MSGQTDAELLAELRTLLDRGAARLDVDPAKLNHMDSPVGVQAESTRWFAILFVACAAAFWFGGWIAGAAVLGTSVVLWFAWVRPATHRRVEQRVRLNTVNDVQSWRQLWRFGGLKLSADSAICTAPDGNWMQFVRDRMAREVHPRDPASR